MRSFHFVAGALLAGSCAASAQAQSPQVFCDNMRRMIAAAGEARPFAALLDANGLAAFRPAPEIPHCTYSAQSGFDYACKIVFPQAQMREAHAGIGQTLTQCLGTGAEPGPADIGKLPSLSWFLAGNVSIHLYPREDWGQYADDAGDEEFTDFGFDLVVARD